MPERLYGSPHPLLMLRVSPSTRRAFTLVEILVVIAIIVLLAAILFPSFVAVREKARSTSCASNLKQIGMAIAQYTQDYDDHYPSIYVDSEGHARDFWDVCQPYIKNHDILYCPSDFDTDECVPADGCTNNGKEISYGVNVGPLWVMGERGQAFEQGGIYSSGGDPFGIGTSLSANEAPDHSFLAADAFDRYAHFMETERYQRTTMPLHNSQWRHGNWRNVLYCDGHVKIRAWHTGWIDSGTYKYIVMLPRNKADYESYCLNPDKKISNWWLENWEQVTQRCGDVAGNLESRVTYWLPD